MRKYFIRKKHKRINFEKWDGSYISMLLIFMRHHGECVSKESANKRHVDPEEWGTTDYDYDGEIVYQNPHIDFMDNGKKVRIHIWGRDDG